MCRGEENKKSGAVSLNPIVEKSEYETGYLKVSRKAKKNHQIDGLVLLTDRLLDWRAKKWKSVTFVTDFPFRPRRPSPLSNPEAR